MNALRAPAEPTDAQAWPVEALRFAPRTAGDGGWRREQVLVGIGVLALHVLLWGLFELESRRRAQGDADADAAIAITYVETLPRVWIRAPGTPVASAVAQPSRPTTAMPRPAVAPRPVPRTSPAPDAPLQLYDRDGALRLPQSVLEDLDRTARDRQFDFQMPNLDAAAKLLDRPPALVYEPTRFDEYWEPNEDLLSEVLRKAVEKTSKEVRIPIPGAPGRFLVCRVSLLAAGGACGVERNGGNAVVSLDDPKTLTPAEAAACQAWWDRIVGAGTQAEWRATRKLYDGECNKPLEKAPAQARPSPARP
jgi:hypothetical protein